ncbi:High affinity transport system protein p37 precursor [Mycoplasmopsis californica]|uniref:ABC transporter substrate-binding protein n=1 Tax=Mycoplasmopsis equigenitalium TaxID=114883 RepID=A0ABY5J1Q3_9BACT|nr:ABC transporter substrate-binding protein [Mycoplasmopsis equigenitalium]UUD37144.1 ABC transporter substrate-binding protein [Mycoplasmopsis equigenitalium]VEU69551.1 High affinity transport system protein p37 precursor [Mycoplasmopsis californica]
MKFTGKLFTLPISLLPLIATVSCFDNANDENGEWDSEITIKNEWINYGFQGTKLESDFLVFLGDRFNEIKNANPKTRNKPNVSFVFETNADSTSMFLELEADNKKQDVAILNYGNFATDFQDINTNSMWQKNLKFKLVAQTSTLKFSWNGTDNVYYESGLDNDPLRKLAEDNNIKWFKETGLEYPEWQEHSNIVPFDGSKYTSFYSNDKELTYVYSGAIYIAGNKKQRDEIITDWNNKDFDRFISHNLVFENNHQAGTYKYQAAILARHFGKSIKEINEILNNPDKNNNYVIRGLPASKTLGKTANGQIARIGFAHEGELNWTRDEGDQKLFCPDGFLRNKDYDDPSNAVIRVLCMTNPAPYDVVLARKNFNDEQLKILTQTLTSLSLEENIYGIYTGYNKFQKIDFGLFKKFVLLQIQAETVKNLVNDIPEIGK